MVYFSTEAESKKGGFIIIILNEKWYHISKPTYGAI
mgnify:CR=1 FL=1